MPAHGQAQNTHAHLNNYSTPLTVKMLMLQMATDVGDESDDGDDDGDDGDDDDAADDDDDGDDSVDT